MSISLECDILPIENTDMVVIIWHHTFDKLPLQHSQVNYLFFSLKVNNTSKQHSEHCESSALVGEAETLWEEKFWKTRHKKKLSSNLINDGFEKASAFRETAAESEGCRLQLGGIATLPMSEHLWPCGSWRGQHLGSWGVCPRWSGGPGKRRPAIVLSFLIAAWPQCSRASVMQSLGRECQKRAQRTCTAMWL